MLNPALLKKDDAFIWHDGKEYYGITISNNDSKVTPQWYYANGTALSKPITTDYYDYIWKDCTILTELTKALF